MFILKISVPQYSRWWWHIQSYSINVQGDSGGKVTILRGDIIGHCEPKKKGYKNICVILNGYGVRAVWIYKIKNILKEMEISCSFFVKCVKDKFVTRKLQIDLHFTIKR